MWTPRPLAVLLVKTASLQPLRLRLRLHDGRGEGEGGWVLRDPNQKHPLGIPCSS